MDDIDYINEEKKYSSTVEAINKKLNPIGLKILGFDLNHNLWHKLDNITLDIIDIEKYYNYFYKQHGLRYIREQIKATDDFRDYNYTIKEFVKEELNESFNNPYAKININDIAILNDQELNYIIEKISDYIDKVYWL
jgi:hypothetical protein